MKSVKAAYQNAKVAEKLGNIDEAKKQLDIANETLAKVNSEYSKPLGSRYNQMNQPKNPNYQPIRNKPDTILGREYSGHALDRMQDRGIMPSVIENTIRNGSKTIGINGIVIYKDPINGIKAIINDKGKVITVTYER